MKGQSNNSVEVSPRKRSIWRGLKAAIKGTTVDYTKIDLKKAIFLLAVPMILELIMESAFAVVDIYYVGKLGASAVATVGLTETYMFLLYSIAMGLATGVTAIIARRIGEKRGEDASKVAIQSIIIAILTSIPFAVCGIFFAKDMLALMGGDAWSLEHGYRYTQWMLGGNMVIVLLFIINAVFRGAGDAAIAMKVLWVANGLNILLDPLLIFGWGPVPAMGIEGAAIATTIGRGIGVVIQLWILFKGGKHIKASLAQLYIDGKTMMNIVKTSLGGVGQMIVAMTSWIFIMRILADIGSDAVAGSTIALRIMMFTLMPAWGLSNAAATLVGQNLGAGHPERAESSVWKIGMYNMFFLIVVSIVYFFFNHALMEIFTDNPNVIAIGGKWLKILSYSYFVYGWWMVSVQAFNGSGDTRTPTKINLVFFWLIQIPLCYFLAVMQDWGYSGVFWAVFVSETGVGLFTLWLFNKGKWKTVQV
ncbi:MATE family efflux transporter [Galbibacter pacificus]|uniref:Multidrug-efflux transporter n=1 Tax=Galbibacter pacificus TaxID=2996052 RepID=A0ABT6FTB7_9FLAO|nr:MATE family efflux transporter [Galbibacter pacificus]MDG3583038.1 MATE family efflux transporter [Galbibacter pacificus]MDG3586519.1 MATE family efflux transporter [Galbibacter pacificus]